MKFQIHYLVPIMGEFYQKLSVNQDLCHLESTVTLGFSGYFEDF